MGVWNPINIHVQSQTARPWLHSDVWMARPLYFANMKVTARFSLSASHHGLQHTDHGLQHALPLGQQQFSHLLQLPARKGAALACRYYTTSPGFLFPERSEVPSQAFSFSHVFRLSQVCRSTNASSLAQDVVVALRPTPEVALAPRSTTALLALQQQQQLWSHQPPLQEQQQQRKRGRSQPQPQQGLDKPWLGAQLDVGGYTKRGFISSGGKDQNQDRGLILEQFRGPNEVLLGVMDGHGPSGHLVSAYLAQHLPAVLMQKLVAAASALSNSSSSNGEPKQQRKLLGSGNKQQKQQQQQQATGPKALVQDTDVALSFVPYVVVPDHWPRYGFATADAAHSSSSSSSGGDTAAARHDHSGGRAVGKQQVVHHAHTSAAVDQAQLSGASSSPSSSTDDSTSSTTRGTWGADASTGSSASSSSNSSFCCSSSQQWLSPVSHESLQQVPLSQELLTSAFTATDWLLSGSGINCVDSGSTAVLCHIGPRSITTAWVGDSRAVLGRRKQLWQLGRQQQQQQEQDVGQHQQQQQGDRWEVVPLTTDHKPERQDEYLRITLNDGRVAQLMGRGPYRVWFKGIDYPGLAMSRAFGDLPCRRIGVCVEPEVTVQPLRDIDEVLVAATDGIWDVLSNEEVVAMAGTAPGAQAAARMLVETAEARWLEVEGGYIDDITAVVVRARPSNSAAAS